MNATEKAIRENFPGKSNKALRAEIRGACKFGRFAVHAIGRRVALTIWGQCGLKAVAETLPSDLQESH